MAVDGEGRKRCPRCGETKRAEAFSRNRARGDGRGSYCRVCAAVCWREGKQKRVRRRGFTDLPGQPGFGNVGRPRAPRAKGRTLEELLGEW